MSSFFLDLLVDSRKRVDLPIFVEDPEFMAWWSEVIYLPVSFNGLTQCTPTSSNSQTKFEFAVRILFAYYFDHIPVGSFERFRSVFEPTYANLGHEDLFLEMVLDRMYKLEKSRSPESEPCFFILLDEISKLDLQNGSSSTQAQLLATKFGAILDSTLYGMGSFNIRFIVVLIK